MIVLRHFKIYEFACPCCGQRHMQEEFLMKLDEARDIAGVPFKILSGYRCIDHNADVPGALANSSHLFGWASDIEVLDNWIQFKIVESLLYVGFKRIVLKKGRYFLHVDLDPDKPQEVLCID